MGTSSSPEVYLSMEKQLLTPDLTWSWYVAQASLELLIWCLSLTDAGVVCINLAQAFLISQDLQDSTQPRGSLPRLGWLVMEPRISVCTSTALYYKSVAPCLTFYMVSENLNSGPHDCRILTDWIISPAPVFVTFTKDRWGTEEGTEWTSDHPDLGSILVSITY